MSKGKEGVNRGFKGSSARFIPPDPMSETLQDVYRITHIIDCGEEQIDFLSEPSD